jgi:hypothetical protein
MRGIPVRRALFLAAACLVWVCASAAEAKSIAEIRASAKEGDLVTVEGRITDVRTGSGSRQIVTLEDDSDRVLIRVPEYLLRELNEGRDPQVGNRVRVSGKWGHAYLDEGIWGLQAEHAERLPD